MAGYIGSTPVPQGIQEQQSFTATAGQTTFNTLGYTDGNTIRVTLNGVLLEGGGVDYTATNGSDIVLTAAASVDDVLTFETFNEFQLVSQTMTTPTISGGTLKSNVTLKNDTEQDTDGGRASKIIYQGEQSGGEISTLAEIQASHDGTADDEKADLIFRVNDGNDGTSPTERLRIESDGVIHAKSGVLELNSESTASSGEIDKIRFRKAHTGGVGTGEYDQAELRSFTQNGFAGGLNVYTSRSTGGGNYASTLAAKFDETGDLQISDGNLVLADGHGIDFSATSNSGGTMSGELLDDYETGTWSPVITDLGGNDATMASQNGKYVKVGNIVTAHFTCTISSKGSMTGNYVFVRTLPYVHAGSNAGSGMVNRFSNLATSYSSMNLELGGGVASYAWFTGMSGTTGTADGYLPVSHINNNFFVQGTLVYTIA